MRLLSSTNFNKQQILNTLKIKIMREYFRISGHFLDGSKEAFEDYIVTNFDDVEEDGRYGEDDIFFFGLNEVDIISAIEKKEHFPDFVITGYEKV